MSRKRHKVLGKNKRITNLNRRSHSHQTRIIFQIKRKFKKRVGKYIIIDYDEDENDSDDQRNQKFQKSESQQPIIMFDMNQFYNLNVGSDVKELLGFMNKYNSIKQISTKCSPTRY
jgi:hypothetical protein